VPRDASHVRLVFAIDPSVELHEGYLEIVDRSGKSIWRSSRSRLPPEGELELILPRKFLPYGNYRVRLFPEADFSGDALAEESLRVENTEFE
jgi:hypothetical protein